MSDKLRTRCINPEDASGSALRDRKSAFDVGSSDDEGKRAMSAATDENKKSILLRLSALGN